MSEPTTDDGYRYGNPDDEHLPLRRCACGQLFNGWDVVLSIYPDDPTTMDCCGRQLYFSQQITIHEVGKSAVEAEAGSRPPQE